METSGPAPIEIVHTQDFTASTDSDTEKGTHAMPSEQVSQAADESVGQQSNKDDDFGQQPISVPFGALPAQVLVACTMCLFDG